MREALASGLASVPREELDTEEAEFVADRFHERSWVVGVNVAEHLNMWLDAG